MKIYLDNNLGVTNVEQEELTQDTIGYNILKVYIPNAVLTPYDTFTCYYGALLQNGRKVGWFAMEARTSSDADYEANYTLYKATLEQCIVSVEGKVYIGCQVLLGNSGNATLIKKNTAVVQFNVRKSVAINNDILVLDTDQTTTDVLESYKNLLENALTTYATKASVYTKQEVNSALALKADKSDTYTKTQVDVKDLNLAAQMASDKLELNNRINTTNNILVETNAKVASLETDVDTLQNNTYSKTEVDEKIDDISAYTKSEIDTMINAKADKTTVEGINTRVGALETDIADLKSVQNVVEVVATKSALNSYDTTKLDANDKVQVIADETHDGASTIYNWDGTQWQYVGAYGTNSYTKQESDNKFAPKTTAVTHTGNQLKDYNGNNIYPNLDAKTQAKIDNAYGPAYVGKDTSTNILAFTEDKGIYVGSDTGDWYYWNGTQYVEGGAFITSSIYTILPTNTDLNTITSESKYLLLESNTYTNMPYNVKSGLLITIELPTLLKEQILIGFGTPDVYIRSYVNGWRRWNSRFYTKNLTNNTDLDTVQSNGIICLLNNTYTYNNNPFPSKASYLITLDAITSPILASCLTQICITFDGSIAIRNNVNGNGYGIWHYNLTYKNENHWSGKTWYAYGTSITNIANEGKYPTYLAQLSGMNLVNKGISGGGIGDLGAYSHGQVYDAICNITDGKLNADLITLECGANDCNENVPLGTIYDTGTSTLCGCFNDCIRYLQANTNAQIVVIPSIPTKTEPNELNQYYKFQLMMKEMCFINRVTFIDGNDCLGYGRINGNTTYTVDTIHQTNLGGYNLAKSIWEKLKNVPLFYTSIPN